MTPASPLPADIRERLDGRRVIVSISGGKDSTATALHLRNLGVEAEYLHMDTGWEAPETEAYVREYLPSVLGPIKIIGRPGGMAALIEQKGMLPSRLRRFCTQELKVFPARDYFDALNVEIVNAIGIRAAESASRASMPEWEESTWFAGLIWRPILRWSMQDVIDIHSRHGVRPNPLYLAGADRVGCYPCIFARKAEIRRMAAESPAAIDRVRALEASVTVAARARAESRGEDMSAWSPPAWFQSRLSSVDGGRCWPIDKVVEWSRTSRGGRQIELFSASESEAGCVRWGLCDTGSSDDPR